MAGSLVVTSSHAHRGPEFPVSRHVVAWTSDATSSGNCSLPLVTSHGTLVISGEILRAQFVPGTSGAQPSNNYSLTLTDAGGSDVLSGQGSTLSNSAASTVCPGVKVTDGTTSTSRAMSCDDQLTLNIASAGNAKSGQLILYVR